MATKQVVLITGASSGFGRIMAQLFVKEGFTVFGTSRNPTNTIISGVQMLQLDVQSTESVQKCVAAVQEKAGKIDILINNAGYMLIGPVEETPVSEMQAQFETNFFGVARMINATLPIMRSQGNGRILIISSLAGLMGIPFKAFYSASKYALEGYAEALKHEVAQFNIHISLLAPGYAKTELGRSKQETPVRNQVYAQQFTHFQKNVTQSISNGLQPITIANTALKVIRSQTPRLHYRIGREAIWLPRIKALLPSSMFDSTLRKRFMGI